MGILLIIGVIGILLLSGAVALEVWLWRRSIIGKAIAVSLAALVGYEIYTAIYPTASFYKAEFQRVTGQGFPEGATFTFKEASYPDIHGDYTSCALIKVTQTQYEFLKSKITNRKSVLGNMGSSCMDHLELTVGKKFIAVESSRDNPGGEYAYWGLVDGSPEVIIQYVSW